MTTVSDIVTRVQRRVIDLPTAVQAEVEELVERAHREIMERHSWEVMERRESRTTTSGDPSLGTIATEYFKEYIPGNPPFWTDSYGHTNFLQISSNESEVRAGFNQSATYGPGAPKVLLHRHQASSDDPSGIEWKVYPVPDGLAQTSDGEYTIQIPYYRYLQFPSSNDWFTDNAGWYITAHATAEAFALNWAENRAAEWLARAEAEFRRLRDLDKRRRVSFVDTMVPYKGANDPKLRL